MLLKHFSVQEVTTIGTEDILTCHIIILREQQTKVRFHYMTSRNLYHSNSEAYISCLFESKLFHCSAAMFNIAFPFPDAAKKS